MFHYGDSQFSAISRSKKDKISSYFTVKGFGKLSENYALIAILIGVVLISLPIGPYRTLDTQLEFSTAQGVLNWGYPYVNMYGTIFNEPPLGFYTEALYFSVVGLTYNNGVFLITLFGVVLAFVVYKIGKEVYGKSTGLFAAAFFALAPWELILTRSFLIDTQCLLLSMVCLYFGILAIRKDSVNLALVSGVFFAAALLTKLYAVFVLVPLLLLYVYHRPKNPKQILLQFGSFTIPAVYSTLLWYQIILKKELFYLIDHNDFKDLNFPNVTVSYYFVPNFLVNYGLGLLFVVATVFSLGVAVLFWKRLSRQSVVFDMVCLASILCILSVEMYLGVTLNLKAPYTSAIKYIYQSLPFFSLAAASLANKSVSLIRSAKGLKKLKKIIFFSFGLAGLILLVSPVVANMNTAHQLTTASFLLFQVTPDQTIGYAFHVPFPVSQDSPLLTVQLLGFMIVLSGLFWASRRFIRELFRPMHRWIVEKTSLSHSA
jgi:4-amino-4-deoxy-L-arabinose transferase-like glycosyltransferase